MGPKEEDEMADCVDPDQTASVSAVCFGSCLPGLKTYDNFSTSYNSISGHEIIKKIFMLNAAEHEISAHKKMLTIIGI